jgi:hypothetical protein
LETLREPSNVSAESQTSPQIFFIFFSGSSVFGGFSPGQPGKREEMAKDREREPFFIVASFFNNHNE